MRRIILAASVAIAALAMPAMAQDPGGHGQGAEHGGGPPPDVGRGGGPGGGSGQDVTIPASPNANDNASGQVQADVRAGTDSHASDRAEERTGASVDRRPNADGDDTDVDNDDANQTADVDDNDGDDARQGNKFGGDVCAPGLAGRDPACVPPGQANQTFTMGQTVPDNFRFLTDLSGVPEQFRTEVPTEFRTDAYRYFYNGDTIYVVATSDNTVAAVIDLDD